MAYDQQPTKNWSSQSHNNKELYAANNQVNMKVDLKTFPGCRTILDFGMEEDRNTRELMSPGATFN